MIASESSSRPIDSDGTIKIRVVKGRLLSGRNGRRWAEDMCREAAVTCQGLTRCCTSPQPLEALLQLLWRSGHMTTTQVLPHLISHILFWDRLSEEFNLDNEYNIQEKNLN